MEILGIDIGGSGMKGAIVDTKKGTIISDRFRVPTPESRKPKAMAEVIKEIQSHFSWEESIGVAFPTVVINGKAKFNSNLHESWKGVQIDDLFCDKCDKNTFNIINDADAAGLAEMRYGAGRHHSGTVLMVTIGTGLGSGLFYDGVLVPNFELGRLWYKNGDLIEHYAADSARKREELEFDVWGKRLNRFLKHIERVITPDFIILGGGVSKHIHKYRDQINIKTPYVVGEKQNNSGIIGAAAYAADHHK
ncbi:polyphosphate--glucose phosphotransferase [Roseivirga pacifica]|uniref:polyphosphate--glucose phosphotransferase n=1 Tax=Roseivirga pacifica TaxID=1267423 RepID=UPI00227A4B6A|nr:ROK family protein [Roseivirga pacifica]